MFPETRQRTIQNLLRPNLRADGRDVQMGTTERNGNQKKFGNSHSGLYIKVKSTHLWINFFPNLFLSIYHFS